MEKRMRRIAMLMAAMMAAGLLAGCGAGQGDSAQSTSGNQTGQEGNQAGEADQGAAEDQEGSTGEIPLDGTWPAETIKIGVEVYDTTEQSCIAYQEYFDYLSEYYNLEFMVSESIQSPEDELDFAGACQSAGCVAYIGGYNASMDTIVQTVTDYGMYYWGAERGLDEQFADNEYYLGGFRALGSDGTETGEGGDYLLGYELAYSLAEQGCKHVVYCNGGAGFGIPMFVDRQNGFFAGIEAAKAAGMEIQFDPEKDIVDGWPGTDTFTAAQSTVLSADYDGIACSFSGMEIWVQPIADQGKSDTMKLAGVGSLSDATGALIESGQIASLIYECEEIVFGNAIPMIINAVNGHGDLVKGQEGYCDLGVARWNIKTYEEFASVNEKHEAGEYYVTAEDMKQFFPEFNKDASKESFLSFYSGLTLEHVTK